MIERMRLVLALVMLLLGACQWVLPLERPVPDQRPPTPGDGTRDRGADADSRVNDRGPADGSATDPLVDATPIPGTWITVKAGTFTMGSPTSEPCRDMYKLDTKETQHPVTLTRDLEVSATEATQAQFEAVMGYNPTTWGVCPDCPVDNISWHQAALYCNRLSGMRGLAKCYTCSALAVDAGAVVCGESPAHAGQKIYDCPGYRLPTEAEWEYAYRAGQSTALHNGPLVGCTSDANAAKIGWHDGNASKPQPVGKLAPNAWGLFDMAGNLWEWCHDRGKADLGPGLATNPVVHAATGTSNHVVRGGSWHSPPYKLRAAYREFLAPTTHGGSDGFRCVRSLP